MAVNYRELVSIMEGKGPDDGGALLRDAYKAKHANPRDVDFGRVFEQCFGHEEFAHCKSTGRSVYQVFEASGPTKTNAFLQISLQTVTAIMMQAYDSPEFVFKAAIPERQSNLSFEKLIGVTSLGDEASVVNESEAYPTATVAETYQHLPETKKRGFQTALTREAVFFDKTGQLQDRLSNGTYSMGLNREKRAIGCVVDEGAQAVSAVLGGHRYHFKGNSIATYGNSSGNHDWDNLQASNGLVDWTDVDAALQLFDGLTDPATGESIVVMPKHLVVTRQLSTTAKHILDATKITTVTPGYATSANPNTREVAGNGVGIPLQILTSPLLASVLATDTDWFVGDISKAFVYVQNWAPAVSSLGANSELEFTNDIIARYKFNELGAYGTMDPRYMVKNTA